MILLHVVSLAETWIEIDIVNTFLVYKCLVVSLAETWIEIVLNLE